MLFPNLISVGLGVATHDDTNATMLIGPVICIGAYVVFLLLLLSYLGRLSALAVVVVAVVWFSLADWGNALWAFQMAWYLILLLLMVMLYLLLVRSSAIAFTAAVAVAVAGSFSSLQGLELWVVGLVCLAWPLAPRLWIRSWRILTWVAVGVITSVIYFRGYTSGIESVWDHYALHHPTKVMAFVLVELGEVIPNTDKHTLWLTGALGTVLLVAAVYVVVRCGQDRRCLPVALILFWLIFYLLSAIGRPRSAYRPSLPRPGTRWPTSSSSWPW